LKIFNFSLTPTGFVVLSSILLFACTVESVTNEREMSIPPLRILTLGDSYTIGEGVELTESWPLQLAAALRAAGFQLDNPIIIARTGWTSGDLLSAIETSEIAGSFDLVTLLIGVNNQYQGRDIESYREEFSILVEMAIDFAGGDPRHVLVLSIPDWGVTPFARALGRMQASAEIDKFNAVNREVSLASGLHYVDITPISRLAGGDEALLAPDELHPSGKMYAAWVDLMLPVVSKILSP
jgi:lysophospholipase L1-like esterase